jgi:alcohol dehydrogenase class IV
VSLVAGKGSVGELGGILDGIGARRVFLVTGRASFEASGARAAVEPGLVGREVVRFAEFAPNPTSDDVQRGVDALRAARCDVVVAVGGGSVLDTAKLVNACAAEDGPAVDYLVKARVFRGGAALPLVAIPTTAGSGAEATHFATVYVDGEKHSAAHAGMLPGWVVLDHGLTMSAGKALTASTGIDALAQGIESYWSTRATDESRGWARDAVVGAAAALAAAVNEPTERVRERMMMASHLAGRAINVARTTAPHALSYAITIGFGVPHGHAVGLTLGAVFAYNGAVRGDADAVSGDAGGVRKTVGELCVMLGVEDAEAGRRRVDGLMTEIGLETRLSRLGVGRADLGKLVASVNDERLANNPRRLPATEIGKLLESVF